MQTPSIGTKGVNVQIKCIFDRVIDMTYSSMEIVEVRMEIVLISDRKVKR